jgi:hypothetical protein
MPNDATIKLRVATEELEEWKRQAGLVGVSLSEFIRMRCNGKFGALASRDPEPMRPPDSASLAERSTGTPERTAGDTRESAPAGVDLEIARKTGHPLGHDCFQCMQVRRFLEPPKVKKDAKAGKPPNKVRRR